MPQVEPGRQRQEARNARSRDQPHPRLVDRRWMALSTFAAGMLAVHTIQGWYPLLPLLRRPGVRSQDEIESERTALRSLRGDLADTGAAAAASR